MKLFFFFLRTMSSWGQWIGQNENDTDMSFHEKQLATKMQEMCFNQSNFKQMPGLNEQLCDSKQSETTNNHTHKASAVQYWAIPAAQFIQRPVTKGMI